MSFLSTEMYILFQIFTQMYVFIIYLFVCMYIWMVISHGCSAEPILCWTKLMTLLFCTYFPFLFYLLLLMLDYLTPLKGILNVSWFNLKLLHRKLSIAKENDIINRMQCLANIVGLFTKKLRSTRTGVPKVRPSDQSLYFSLQMW